MFNKMLWKYQYKNTYNPYFTKAGAKIILSTFMYFSTNVIIIIIIIIIIITKKIQKMWKQSCEKITKKFSCLISLKRDDWIILQSLLQN